MTRRWLLSTLVVAPVALVASCTDNSATRGAQTIAVTSTDDACQVAALTAPSGNLVFDVTNAGSEVTEFYLLAADGVRVVAEVENVGPGITRQLVVSAAPGAYFTVCKPGMAGEGIRAAFNVTDSGVLVAASGEMEELLAKATREYAVYVNDQAAQLLTATKEFAVRYRMGDDDAARALYPRARTYWERIEPVAESFGDLDPKLDLREADLAEGETWTGWHRIEKDLWPPASGYMPLSSAERSEIADLLVVDTKELFDRVQTVEFSADQLGNGAKELLDEVATGKVTGEEEIWSHTDLWDFQANIDGARVAFEVLEPALRAKDDALADVLDERFMALQALLDTHRVGDGFAPYDDLSVDEVRQLSDAVNALSEPLSRLTAAVVL